MIGLPLVVSIALHLVAFAGKGVELALAWGMLTIPLLWCLGLLSNAFANVVWDRRLASSGRAV